VKQPERQFVYAQWIEKREQMLIPMLNTDMEYISIKEYSERFALSGAKTYNGCAGGGLNAICLGRIWRIPVKRSNYAGLE
jgi:hypothetical protein